jgi:hypothetical protein
MTIHYKGCEDTALKEAFPVLFGIVCAKDAYDTAHGENSFMVIKWNVSFARVAHNWEVDAFASFFRMLYLTRMRQGKTSCGGFFPKDGCLVLNPYTLSWVVKMVFISFRRIFGRLRFP